MRLGNVEWEAPFAVDVVLSKVHASQHHPLAVLTWLDGGDRESGSDELRTRHRRRDEQRGSQREAGHRAEHVVGRALDLVDRLRERGPCNMTRKLGGERAAALGAGCGRGHPAWPGRSGMSPRDSSPTARTSVTMSVPSSQDSYSASPSLTSVAPRSALKRETYRWSGPVRGGVSTAASSASTTMGSRRTGPNAASHHVSPSATSVWTAIRRRWSSARFSPRDREPNELSAGVEDEMNVDVGDGAPRRGVDDSIAQSEFTAEWTAMHADARHESRRERGAGEVTACRDRPRRIRPSRSTRDATRRPRREMLERDDAAVVHREREHAIPQSSAFGDNGVARQRPRAFPTADGMAREPVGGHVVDPDGHPRDGHEVVVRIVPRRLG